MVLEERFGDPNQPLVESVVARLVAAAEDDCLSLRVEREEQA